MTTMTITPEGRRALEDQLKELYARRPQVVEQIVISRDEAELAESSAYLQAREEQALVEGRIVELESILRRAEVVDRPTDGRVELGSKVVVEDSSEETEFHLVDPFAVDPAAGRISAESPVGRALLGARPGETVVAQTPSGPRPLRVRRILGAP
jgi:transcription elongation factor GreA